MRKKNLRKEGAALLALLVIPLNGAMAQAVAPIDAPSLGETIDRYVLESLQSNLALKAESLGVEANFAALDAAQARFFPTMALGARYSWSQGGREFNVPIGSLINPAYESLNQLLAAQGQPGQFPTVTDQSFRFQREREQDTRLTLRQPIYAPAIPAAVRTQRAQLDSSQFARIALGRRLKRDVTVAYLDWLKARKSVEIVQTSTALLEENQRVNESLFRNGKVTEDQVLRARAELLAVTQQLREAENGQTQARSYLNFLRNRPLEEDLIPAAVEGEVARTVHDLGELRAAALANRPELKQLENAAKAAEARADIVRSDGRPTLSLGMDMGTQGEKYEFGQGRDFRTISLVLNWQLFDAGAVRAETRRAEIAARQATTRRNEAVLQIQLEVQQALDRLETTSDSLATARARADAARTGFRIASRKRDEGVINQVEFVDARGSLTSAELNLNVTMFDLLARQAELDYATAAGALPLDVITGTR